MFRPLRRVLIAGVTVVVCAAGTLWSVHGATADPSPAAVDEQTLFTKGEGGYACYRIPAVVRTKSGALLAFAEARKTWCTDDGDIDLVMRRSDDDGDTWTDPVVVLSGTDDDPNAAATRGNPVPIVDAETGRIVLLSTFNPGDSARPRTPYLQYSDDDGKTWSTARSLESDIDGSGWGWYATGPGHAIQLTRGDHAGRLVAGVNFSDDQGRNGAALVYSDDHGDTWKRGATDIRASNDVVPQELSLFEQRDGGIYAAARDNNGTDPGNRAFAISPDGGDSFTSGFATIPDLRTPVVQGSTLRLRASDTGDRYDRVIFASPSDTELRRTMTIRSSYDEGAHWEGVGDGTVITDDRAGYSDLTQVDGDRIGLLYEAGDYPNGDARDTIRFTRFTESDLGLPDDLSGTCTPDSSTLGNDARLRGDAAINDDGRFDSAAALDGDGHVGVPFAESLALGAGDFTAMTWFRYDATTGNHPLLWAYNQGAEVSQLWLRAEPEQGRIRGWIQNRDTSSSVVTDGAYNDGQWHHAALRRADGALELWIDGALAASGSAIDGTVSPARPFKMDIGRRLDGGQYFTGSLDETRIYRRGLTATELGDVVSDNAAVPDGLALRLPFDTTC